MKYSFKKIIKKIGLGSLYTFLITCFILVIALNWPMPTLEMPRLHEHILIKSISIIDVETGDVKENQDVFIVNDRIKSIGLSGTLLIGYEAFEVDGTNKYLIPGLWDMHTHSIKHSEWLHHPLYIANGVTGIRDMSGTLHEKDSYWVGSDERLQWNKDLQNNIRITPRYVLQSSYQMDGESSVPIDAPEFFKLNSPKDVQPLLDYYSEKEVDFIKIYQQIKPESYRELALQVSKYDMHLAGHKPMFVKLREAVESGQRSFEHGRIFMFECFPNADSLRISSNWRKNYTLYKKEMVDKFNYEKARHLMSLMAEKNAYWVPTLQTLKFESNAHIPAFIDHPNLKYISWVRKNLWWSFDVSNNSKRNLDDRNNTSQKFYDKVAEQILMAKNYNVPIMVGTDVTDSYVFAGYSVHTELEDLTKSGLSNLEALQSATIIPAQFVGEEKKYGTVDIDKIADLIILDKNPLIDIKNSTTISSVLMNGVLYDSSKLEQLKNFTSSVSSSFHVNVKLFYSLVDSPLIRMQFAD